MLYVNAVYVCIYTQWKGWFSVSTSGFVDFIANSQPKTYVCTSTATDAHTQPMHSLTRAFHLKVSG